MLRVVEKSVRAITPHVLGTGAIEGFPEAVPRDSTDLLDDWFESSIPEFQALTTLAFLALNLYCLIWKGRTFPRLDHVAQAGITDRVFGMKSVIAFPFVYLLSTPAVTAYYSREDVQAVLGFDIGALKEEAAKRVVTRRGELGQPSELDAETSPGETTV